jgi:hypothetical protein
MEKQAVISTLCVSCNKNMSTIWAATLPICTACYVDRSYMRLTKDATGARWRECPHCGMAWSEDSYGARYAIVYETEYGMYRCRGCGTEWPFEELGEEDKELVKAIRKWWDKL